MPPPPIIDVDKIAPTGSTSLPTMNDEIVNLDSFMFSGSKYENQNLNTLKSLKRGQEMRLLNQELKLREEREKQKMLDRLIAQKEVEEEEKKRKEQMNLVNNNMMPDKMTMMMKQQMEVMMKMSDNMLKQSEMFTQEMARMKEDGQGSVKSRLGRGGGRMSQTVLRRPVSTTRLHQTYKPYQYSRSSSAKPDLISNGTKKKQHVTSQLPDDLVLCEITDNGPVAAQTPENIIFRVQKKK